MNKRILLLIFLISSLAISKCALQETEEKTPFVFSPPQTIFPPTTPTSISINNPESQTTPTVPTVTSYAAPTPRKWALPYYGTPGQPTQITPIPHPAPVFHDTESIVFLLLGSDKKKKSFRTDTMIIVIFQQEYRLVTLLSIPRDLYVYIPGWKMERINAAYQAGENRRYPGGGPALVKDTLLYNLGIDIDYYALVEFQGFKDIIDIFGGVEVPVVCPYTELRPIEPHLDYNDEANLLLHTINPGVVNMDGDTALWYVRARKKTSDFDRTRRQQEMLRALYSQALRLDMIVKIPQLYEEITQSVITDFTLVDALALAPQIFDLPSSQIRSFYISSSEVTSWTTPQIAYVKIPKARPIYDLLQKALSPPDEEEQSRVGLVVEILNGTAAFGWEILAAERLHYAGYDTVINPADRHNYSQTLIFDHTEAQDPQQAANLLALFELNELRLIKFPDPSYPYDYKVILGADYEPCFKSVKIVR
jgi:LCP family protein required for cell wall assembly